MVKEEDIAGCWLPRCHTDEQRVLLLQTAKKEWTEQTAYAEELDECPTRFGEEVKTR